MGRLAVLFLLVIAAGLGLALFQMSRPQDLADVGGVGPAAPSAGSRDITVVLQNAVKRRIPVTLTEAEINRWLATRIRPKQGGALAADISFESVRVRLEDGRAEWILERSVMGRPATISMYTQVIQTEGPKGVEGLVERHGGRFHEAIPYPNVGGRFGRLPIPQGFLVLVMPSFAELAGALAPEWELIEQMARIRIEKGRLVLDPRDPSESSLGAQETF